MVMEMHWGLMQISINVLRERVTNQQRLVRMYFCMTSMDVLLRAFFFPCAKEML